ncbi:MAG: cytochrome P450 [Tychonema bourrellyi B0820]|uniref:Cytochrome P450 n=1 Tax=Tychonema bourrellyi FEM_GT703 TaxID=2040638 RepID=A0A2G4F5X5_9CYAN|nr:cytochrome P450 [Tychonema bourrellyi]MDQ2097752.1 cytochrome P450 [Tychonema bourrellyi B0820]PHX56887.1 cytochrome P450 [Tychonema bourrellyi FEM_GT703]
MTLPNGPKTLPFVQLIQWIADPLTYMDKCASQYGDIFTTQWGNLQPFVMVNHPEAVQFMLNSSAFEAPGHLNSILKPLLGEQSMIILSGERHKRQRQLLMPPFHGERMRNYGQQICDIALDVASKWSVDRPFFARSAMQEVTMRVILQAVFGLDDGPRLQELRPLLASVVDMTGSPLRSSMLFFGWMQQDWGAWSPWGRMKQRQRKIDELIYAEIAERREQPDASRTDILSLMMAARDENGEPMTDEELRDELMTLLFAGHETTATALAWAFYWIHSLPSVRQKLLQELDSLGENPDPMEIFRLPYLSAVCQETLRIYPVGMLTFPREVKSPVELMGYQLEPGTVVVGSIYLTHRREDLYPEPLQFKPERFLERQFSPYEYVPFGGGSRRCIGMALAQLEMKLVLANILRDFDLALAENQPVQPKRRGVTLGPAGGVRMVMRGRRMRYSQKPEPVVSGV